MDFMLAAAVVAAATAFDLCPAQAYRAPWCAVINMGNGDVHWDCQYGPRGHAVPNVLAGNRGFCNENPAWSGGCGTPAIRPPHRKHHVNRD